jgi:hypothetical protein
MDYFDYRENARIGSSIPPIELSNQFRAKGEQTESLPYFSTQKTALSGFRTHLGLFETT